FCSTLPASLGRLCLALGIVSFAQPVAADTYPRQRGVDALHYAFHVTLSDESDEVSGEAKVELRFVEEGVTYFVLDLASPSSGKGMTVTAVTSGTSPTPYEHKDDRLRISLDPAPKLGDRRAYIVTYHGVPATGLRTGPNRHGDRTFFSENWPDKAR